jgi:hypothetical protein
MTKTYTVEWQTTTTHKATIEAESDNDLFNNFGSHTYDDQTITDEEYINGSYKILKIT